MLHGDNSFPEDQHATYDLDSFVLSKQNGLERHTEHCQPFPIYIKIFTWPKTFVSDFLLVRWSLSLARERASRLRRSPNLPSGGPNLPWLFSFPRKKKTRLIAGFNITEPERISRLEGDLSNSWSTWEMPASPARIAVDTDVELPKRQQHQKQK